jgi:hypothetical protein
MKVTTLQPVRHDGKRFDVDSVLDLDKKAAQALIACGAAEEGGSLKKPTKAEAEAEAAAKALEAATQAVTDAEAALAAAADDAAKAAAQQALDDVTAALQALQA